jgi:hypothetical protein
MERRTNARFEVQFEARVTVASDRSHSVFGRVSDISSSGLCVVLPFQLAAADTVEIEIADSLLLGRVIYSTPNNSLFRTGIEATRVVLGATDLSSLLQRILSETLPEIPGLESTEAHFG